MSLAHSGNWLGCLMPKIGESGVRNRCVSWETKRIQWKLREETIVSGWAMAQMTARLSNDRFRVPRLQPPG